MINEVTEVKNYLDGRCVNKKNLYRICCLLAKWHKEQGLSHAEIRAAIFAWAKSYRIYIKYNLNSIIYRAMEDKSGLRDDITVRVSSGDIAEINSRFDSRGTKLTALAMLCYAKAYADGEKSFDIPVASLSAWVNIDKGNLSGRHIRELLDFGYISKALPPENGYVWNSGGDKSRYRMCAEVQNIGEYELRDNNIQELYAEAFG